MRRATGLLVKSRRFQPIQTRFLHSKNPESSDPSDAPITKPWSRVQDAYDPLYAELSSPSRPTPTSSTYENPYESSSSTAPPTFLQPPSARTTPLRRQKEKLSDQERITFQELLGHIMPQSTSGAGVFDAYGQDASGGIGKLQSALSKTAGAKAAMWERKARTSLSAEEEEELDRKRETMMAFATDYQLFQWALTDVFAFTKTAASSTTSTLFPDPRTAPALPTYSLSSPSTAPKVGPSSRIYPDLLLLLFLILRDTHRSPTAALHIFTLASLTPYSYVLGCTTALYNEVLRTRWMEGDVESVAESLEEMRSSGVKLDEGTKNIVTAIGEAIRIDEARAEVRAAEKFEKDRRDLSEEEVARSRLFNPEQIRAWGRMEWIVEENQDEMISKKATQEAKRKREWNIKKEQQERERQEAEEEHFHLTSTPSEGERAPMNRTPLKNEELDLSGRVIESEPEDYDIFSSPRPSRALRSMEDEDRLQLHRHQPPPRYGDERSSTGRSYEPSSESSDFPRRLASEFDRPPPSTYSSSNHFSSVLAQSRSTTPPPPPSLPRRTLTQELSELDSTVFDSVFDSIPSRAPVPPSIPSWVVPSDLPSYRVSPQTRQNDNPDDNERNERKDRSVERPEKPEKRSRFASTVDDAGNIVLPRRPSFANPFKIRRKGLTKEEKAKKDTAHPLLFWKKPTDA